MCSSSTLQFLQFWYQNGVNYLFLIVKSIEVTSEQCCIMFDWLIFHHFLQLMLVGLGWKSTAKSNEKLVNQTYATLFLFWMPFNTLVAFNVSWSFMEMCSYASATFYILSVTSSDFHERFTNSQELRVAHKEMENTIWQSWSYLFKSRCAKSNRLSYSLSVPSFWKPKHQGVIWNLY